jgi:hypothetical protein
LDHQRWILEPPIRLYCSGVIDSPHGSRNHSGDASSAFETEGAKIRPPHNIDTVELRLFARFKRAAAETRDLLIAAWRWYMFSLIAVGFA